MLCKYVFFKPVEQLCLAMSQCCLCMQPLTKPAATATQPCFELSLQSLQSDGGEAVCTGLAACQWLLAFLSSGLPAAPGHPGCMNRLVGDR